MKREFFKTMLLYFFVILSIVMATNIWSGKELWSEDYSSFLHNVKNMFFGKRYVSYVNEENMQSEDFYGIQWISLSYGGIRSLKYSCESDYKIYADFVGDLKKDIKKSGTVSPISQEDYINAFKGNGAAIKFNTYISLTDYLNCTDTFFDTLTNPRTLELFFAVPSDSSVKYMYFCDYNTLQNFRVPVEFTIPDSLENMTAKNSTTSDSFSFELNFDKQNEDLKRITISSLVPVTLEDKYINVPEASKLNYEDDEVVYDNIFKKFNIKKNSARSYTDNKKTISFIESHATLKIYENGSYTYEAGESFDGINIGDSDEMQSVVLFVNMLYKESVDNDAYVSLKKITENEDGTTQYEFSYSTPYSNLYFEEENAVIVKVKDGNLVYCRQILLDVKDSGRVEDAGSVINAYDELYNLGLNIDKSELQITDIYPVNVYGKDEKVSQKWYIEFSDGSHVFL